MQRGACLVGAVNNCWSVARDFWFFGKEARASVLEAKDPALPSCLPQTPAGAPEGLKLGPWRGPELRKRHLFGVPVLASYGASACQL